MSCVIVIYFKSFSPRDLTVCFFNCLIFISLVSDQTRPGQAVIKTGFKLQFDDGCFGVHSDS